MFQTPNYALLVLPPFCYSNCSWFNTNNVIKLYLSDIRCGLPWLKNKQRRLTFYWYKLRAIKWPEGSREIGSSTCEHLLIFWRLFKNPTDNTRFYADSMVKLFITLMEISIFFTTDQNTNRSLSKSYKFTDWKEIKTLKQDITILSFVSDSSLYDFCF